MPGSPVVVGFSSTAENNENIKLAPNQASSSLDANNRLAGVNLGLNQG